MSYVKPTPSDRQTHAATTRRALWAALAVIVALTAVGARTAEARRSRKRTGTTAITASRSTTTSIRAQAGGAGPSTTYVRPVITLAPGATTNRTATTKRTATTNHTATTSPTNRTETTTQPNRPETTTQSNRTDPRLRRIGFRSQTKLDEHFAKHGGEFGRITEDQYLAMAQDLRDALVSNRVIEATQLDGTISRFDRQSGAFLAFNDDLTIRTFFKPNDGEAYFRRAAGRTH